MNEAITKKIEQVLAYEGLNAVDFSRIMFGLGGLFNELCEAEGDRKAVANSALFRRANERLTQLQQAELEALRKARVPIGANAQDGTGANARSGAAERATDAAPD